MQDIVIEFPMEDLASTGSGDASVGHKCYVTLPALRCAAKSCDCWGTEL